MELLFVTKAGDAFGELAVSRLAKMDHSVRILSEGETAPRDSIALFTPLNLKDIGSRRRFLHCSAIRIDRIVEVPDWVTTPFRAGIVKTEYSVCGPRPRGRGGKGDGFGEALANLAKVYGDWHPSASLVPWAEYERDQKIAPDSECMKRTIRWRQSLEGINIRTVSRTQRLDYRTVQVNAWRVNFSDRVEIFSDMAIEQSLVLLSKWQSTFRVENTWSRRELGTPSLVVRLDCVMHDGKLTVYEVEERPSGLGVSSMANPFFKDRLGQVLETWPDFRVVVSGQRAGTDDHIWMDALNRPIQPDAPLVLVRAEPEETEFHHFESQSVSSLIAKGDKSYGETLGLWRRVHMSESLPWEKGFVLKPKQGSKMHDVEIWDPLKRPGHAVRARIVSAMQKHENMFLQELVDPMKTGNPRFEWMIYRVFFGYNTLTKSWECLGGNWNARSNLRIHGASDAVFGPLVLK